VIKKLYNFVLDHNEELLVIILLSLVVSSTILTYAYSRETYVVKNNVIKYGLIKAQTTTAFIVKPTLLYGYKSLIHSDKTYYSIAKRALINFTINYVFVNNTELGKILFIKPNIDFKAKVKTNNWDIDYYVNTSKIGKAEYSINTWLSDITSVVDKIDSDINTRTHAIEYTIYIDIDVIVRYSNSKMKKYSLNPIITIKIDKEKNKVSIIVSNTYTEFKRKTYIKNPVLLNPLGIKIAELRFYSLLSTITLASIALPLTMIYLSRTLSIRKQSFKRYIPKKLDGRIIDYGDKTIVEVDLKTLKNLANYYKVLPIYDPAEKSICLVLHNTIYLAKIDDEN